MPFTPTHVLAVLPLRRRLPLAALVVGAMVPDLPLYFSLGIAYETTHSAAGIVLACLPLGLLSLLLFEHLLRDALVALAPARWRHALGSRSPGGGWRGWGLIALALAIGAVSHVVWDAFTHPGRWGTDTIAALNEIYAIGPLRAHGYNWFQHGSSAVGLPLLAWLGARALARGTGHPSRHVGAVPPARRLAVLAVLIGVPAARGLLASASAEPDLEARLYDLVTVGGRWLVLAALAYGAVFRLRPRWFVTDRR